MKDSGRQKDRQRWERKEWASLVEKHPRRVKASPWGHPKSEAGHRFALLYKGDNFVKNNDGNIAIVPLTL